MPFDFAPATLPPIDAGKLAGVPRHLLVRHAMERIPHALRGAVAEMEVAEAGTFVNMGMNFDSIAWRAVWRRPGLPAISGTIPVWRGEIAA